MRSYSPKIFAAAVVLAGFAMAWAFTGLVAVFKLQATAAEANLFSNLHRAETFIYEREPVNTVIVGSSIAARLLPKHFLPQRIHSLAFDGGRPQMGMQLLLESPQTPRLVLVEMNRLLREPNRQEPMLWDSLNRSRHSGAQWLVFLRTEYRPSSIAYSLSKDAFLSRPNPLNERQKAIPITVIHAPAQEVVSDNPKLKQAFEQIAALQARGCEVVLLNMPSNGRDSVEELLKETPMPIAYIDLAAHLRAIGYKPRYSDGLHLDPSSAREVSALLARFLDTELDEQNQATVNKPCTSRN